MIDRFRSQIVTIINLLCDPGERDKSQPGLNHRMIEKAVWSCIQEEPVAFMDYTLHDIGAYPEPPVFHQIASKLTQPPSVTQPGKTSFNMGFVLNRLLPGTNCKQCGRPTCLAFAFDVAKKRVTVDGCPPLSEPEHLADRQALVKLTLGQRAKEAEETWMDSIRRIVSNRWLVLAARLLLGGIFLLSAIGKLQHSALFVDQVVDYGLLPEGLSRLYATVLPWAEVAVGFSLILGLLSAVGAIVSAAMTVSFAIAGIYSLLRPEEVPSLCGCFGELVDLSHTQSLTLDVAMLLAAVVIVVSWRRADEMGVMSLVKGIVPRPAGVASHGSQAGRSSRPDCGSRPGRHDRQRRPA